MKRNKLIIPGLIIAIITIISSCETKSEKSIIANSMKEYIEPSLAEEDEFNFIGLSNRRDTTFMGAKYPCIGVIYSVTDESGDKIRHFADVIFSNDYKTVLSTNELNFDPIDFAEQKIREAFREKISKKSGN